MRGWITCAVLASAMMASQPSWAASGLECMDEGYSAEQLQIFEGFYDSFSMATFGDAAYDPSEVLVEPVAQHAAGCTLKHGWSQDALQEAIVYRMSALLGIALEAKSPLTADQMESLEQALANADQDKLDAILRPGIEASLNGQPEPEMSDDDAVYLGLLVISAGLPPEQAYSEYVGGLLATRMMRDIAAERFHRN